MTQAKRPLLAILCVLVGICVCVGQNEPAKPTDDASNQKVQAENLVANPETTISKEKLPAGSRVFVGSMASGFDTYLVAGLEKKKVPLVIVADKAKADFEISGISESEKAGWAKMFFMGSAQSAEQASIKITNLQTGAVVFAYSVNKGNSVRGKQSAGEACAKHIKEKIETK